MLSLCCWYKDGHEVFDWRQIAAERFRLRRNWLNGRCSVRTFTGHTQSISCVQLTHSRIASGSSDSTIKVCCLMAKGKEKRRELTTLVLPIERESKRDREREYLRFC